MAIGDSTAVNGCCLTVVAFGDDWFEADVSDETYIRTSLGDLEPGAPVNLERPVRLADRLGGHLVQGHVDAVGTVVVPVPDLRIRMAPDLLRYVVEKGSITVDGVQPHGRATPRGRLHRRGDPPHGRRHDARDVARPGDRVNLEVDVIAKYTERLLADRTCPPRRTPHDQR